MDNQIKSIIINWIKNYDWVSVLVKEDPCCGGAAIRILVVTDEFDGVPMMKRHQIIQKELFDNKVPFHEI